MKFTVFTTKLRPFKLGWWVMKFTISGPLSTVSYLRGRQKLVLCTIHSKVDPAPAPLSPIWGVFSFRVVYFFIWSRRGNQFSARPRTAPSCFEISGCAHKKFSTNVFISDHCKKTSNAIILWILRNLCILYNHFDIADYTYYAANSLIIHTNL